MKKGFSIPELIVVISVLGILVGIITFSYSGVQKRAVDTTVQTDLEQMADQFEIFRTRSITDTYPATQAHLESLDIKVTKNAYITTATNIYACVAADFKSFAIVSQSKSGAILKITNATDTTPFTPASSFTLATTCSSLGMNLILTGWQSGAWRAWVT